jgi:hypothetical protein
MHLNEDDLVLHYYGEMSGADESRATTHLSECGECHRSYRQLQRVLAAVDEAAMGDMTATDLPPSFERTVWARLEPNLRPERGRFAWFVLSPVRLAWAAAIVALVAGAFFAGRVGRPGSVPAVEQTAASAGQVRERILLIDLGEHLDRSQMVLVELVSAESEQGADISGERARAEQLLAANRLYRQTASVTGDAAIAQLLDELERVLVDVAASPERLTPQDLTDVQQRIESKGLLFKVRVLSTEVRERQRSAIQERVGQRSSL